ncbi:luciferase-like monooxygenase [Nocardioides albertanoniae]|uniref:Luciferase-like monooxygenase n=1 Tax=Nocardioides albertanoniae TaxID=1175486 RepID=A0A543A1F8_9ACTN|nr:LLM class flavin-dependent oxidoreductase [Nocardioides albertanoniae]TQL66427.1 luciferase-like monooxygenase [Nocardioides albertanoniae]
MKISLWPNLVFPTADILAEAQAADQAGWFGVWVADHYMPNTGTDEVDDGPMHEVWGILPALAATTQNVRIGPLVSPTTIHHPALLANRAATIDHIARGRFVLGLGAGWQINEHNAYGIELPPAKVLVDRFEEAIEVTRSLLDKPRTTFEGTYFQVADAPCEPKPVASPLPILVGAKGPRMLRVVAQHADEWNTWGTPEKAGAVRAKLLEACEQVGRDPGTMRTTTNLHLDLDGANPAVPAMTQTGSVDELQDLIGRYVEAGFDEYILPTRNLGATGAERIERAAQLKAEIIDPVLAR